MSGQEMLPVLMMLIDGGTVNRGTNIVAWLKQMRPSASEVTRRCRASGRR
jgi:hypothetical protein